MTIATLGISAVYHETGDFIEVITTLYDTDGEPVDPTEIQSCDVSLRKGGATIADVTGLDRFCADENLAFTVVFNRPLVNRGLRARAVFVDTTDRQWVKSVAVTTGTYSNSEGDLGDNRPNILET